LIGLILFSIQLKYNSKDQAPNILVFEARIRLSLIFIFASAFIIIYNYVKEAIIVINAKITIK
jgi:hypothetical protein